MNYLRKLLGLCLHEYEVIQEMTIRQNGLKKGKIYVQKCKHCGKLHNHYANVPLD